MLDVFSLRQQFPALLRVRDGQMPIFLDGPGGTQVACPVFWLTSSALTISNRPSARLMFQPFRRWRSPRSLTL